MMASNTKLSTAGTTRVTVRHVDLDRFIDFLDGEGLIATRRVDLDETSMFDVPHLTPREAIAAGASSALPLGPAGKGRPLTPVTPIAEQRERRAARAEWIQQLLTQRLRGHMQLAMVEDTLRDLDADLPDLSGLYSQ